MTTVNKHSGSFNRKIIVKTSRRTELQDVTEEVKSAVRDSGCNDGICHLYVPHTTAGVLINEGYDPAVAREIEAAFDGSSPWSLTPSMTKEIPTRTSRPRWLDHRKHCGLRMGNSR
jgi:secondary thiamine-phosphate synthase enzyme